MNRSASCISKILLAALAMPAAPALAEPVPLPPPSPPAGPVPVPYPNPEPPPTPECPASLCPKLGATLQLGPGGGATMEVESFSWGDTSDRQAAADTSDPQEGGQVAGTVASSDPQEGGEVAASAGRKAGGGPPEYAAPKRRLPGMNKSGDVVLKRGVIGSGAPVKSAIPTYEVTSPRDVATGQASGKRQHGPISMTRGSLTVLIPYGACIAGARYPAVTLQTDSHVYSLQDVTVASCAPAATAKGKKDKAKLDYMIVTMETVLVTG